MTILHKPVKRVSNSTLSHSHGSDKNRRLRITLLPGNGGTVPDMIELCPEGRRQSKARRVTVEDLWSYLLRCESNQKLMARLRERKAKKQQQQQERAWKRQLKKEP